MASKISLKIVCYFPLNQTIIMYSNILLIIYFMIILVFRVYFFIKNIKKQTPNFFIYLLNKYQH